MRTFVDRAIHWLGHDTFKLVGERTVCIDPYEIGTPGPADILCITHNHFDHCSPADIAKVCTEHTVMVGPADCLDQLSGNKRPIRVGETQTHGGITIESVPAYNLNKDFHPRGNGWMGFIITMGGVRIYHAGDTDRIPELKHIRADIALLPVSGVYVMTAEEAVEAALDIGPKIAIPMHYGRIVGELSDAERFRNGLAGKIDVVIKERE